MQPARLYDLIAPAYNLTSKLNGYEKSIAGYLKTIDLGLGADSKVLDAGSGTGMVTRAAIQAGVRPNSITALDISRESLCVARDERRGTERQVQGCLLDMPFADNAFDLVLSCGAVEYVPLAPAMQEVSRVLKPGGLLVLIAITPSWGGAILQFLYRFKHHSQEHIILSTDQKFTVIDKYEFPKHHPISWCKNIYLLQNN